MHALLADLGHHHVATPFIELIPSYLPQPLPRKKEGRWESREPLAGAIEKAVR